MLCYILDNPAEYNIKVTWWEEFGQSIQILQGY